MKWKSKHKIRPVNKNWRETSFFVDSIRYVIIFFFYRVAQVYVCVCVFTLFCFLSEAEKKRKDQAFKKKSAKVTAALCGRKHGRSTSMQSTDGSGNHTCHNVHIAVICTHVLVGTEAGFALQTVPFWKRQRKKKSCQYKSSWCFRGSAGGTASLLLSLWALLRLLYFSRLASLSRFLTSCIAVTQMGELSNTQERFKVLLKSAATRRNRPQ